MRAFRLSAPWSLEVPSGGRAVAPLSQAMWNTDRSKSFTGMTIAPSQLLEESLQIAWEYLERTGELRDGGVASRFLSEKIEAMIRRGERSRLALSNRAISAYQRFQVSPTPSVFGS